MIMSNLVILYVEDDLYTQELIKTIFEDEVKEFYQAYNGQEGLEIYNDKKPDIVLTDIKMPIMDGLEMSRKIKSSNKCQPIIITSSFDDRDTLFEAVNLGIDCFTPKPLDIDMIREKLNFIASSLESRKRIEEDQNEQISTLYKLAHFDSLTGLLNRTNFNIKLKNAKDKAMKNNSIFMLLFIDLDNFKQVNDTYGHQVGDEILKSFAINVKKVIRHEDTFARISGDEFVLIIENISNKAYIDDLSKKILEVSCVPISIAADKINVTCSIGISVYPNDTKDIKQLVDFADIAMYNSKKSGKSTYSYYSKY